MKKRNLAFISLILGSLLVFTSCDFESIFSHYTEVEISVDQDIANGSIQVYTDADDPSRLIKGDTIYVKAIPDDNYKLESLLINDKEVNNDISIVLSKKSYEITATFSLFSEENTDSIETLSSINTTYLDLYNSQGLNTSPSVGDVNILVVPVEFTDYSDFTSDEIDSINLAFNGDSSKDYETDYWESVKSFYYESSYGALNYNFVMCDTFTPSITGKKFIELENDETSSGQGSLYLLDEIYNNLYINNSKVTNYSAFDSNSDGYVDGVWLIYNADDYGEVYYDSEYWAYTYSYISNTPNTNNPTFSRYANASQIFLRNSDAETTVDPHTLIHETGHLLGLDDYYTYDDEAIYSATGGVDMMDLNIGDHNAFSKFSLGWGTPLIVTESTRINLKPSYSSGEYIILPIGNTSINHAFNEYILIEYYQPKGLFELDASSNYRGNYPAFYDYYGVRIYHIDARTYNAYDLFATANIDIDTFINRNGNLILDNSLYYYVAASNTASYSYNTDGAHNLIEQITPFNIRSYETTYLGLNRYGNEYIQGLFTSGDVFNINNQSNFFTNGKANNGYTIDYSVRVEGTYDGYASLTIEVN